MRIVMAAFASFLILGCGDSNVQKVNTEVVIKTGVSKDVYEWNYKGHLYLIVGDGDSGYSVTHAGHCSCGRR